jgi:hypothetical protein
MLYDKRWDKKSDLKYLLNIKTLVSWLKAKPKDEEYVFSDCQGRCLFSQYIIAHGVEWHNLKNPEGFAIWMELHELYGHIAIAHPQTFGGALSRAQSLQSEASHTI